MAYRINPTPSEGMGSTTTKKKKEPTSGYVTNTATPPPQLAPEVTNTTNTTPTAKSGFVEDVPKPLQPSAAQVSAAKQSIANQNTANQSTVNNNQNTTPSTNTAKTVSYDSTPIPQTQLKTTKPQVQANYMYTEPKTNTANQYTSPYNGYMGQNSTNNSGYLYMGQNSYSATPKPLQIKNDYVDIQKQNAVDEMWAKYGAQLMGKNEIVQPLKPTKTSDSRKQKKQTVKAGKSTINIRDDGSTIPYDSDTAIDLFDFLDFLSGRYGPNNEMAESVKIAKPTEPDLVAGAAQYPSVQGKPVMKYENMVNPPSAEYQKKAAELYEEASNNRDFYLKAKEVDVMNKTPEEYYLRLPKLWNIKNKAEDVKMKIYSYNENETDENNNNKQYVMNEANIDGTKPNAFQHMFWSAFLAEEIGTKNAYDITTAHEIYTEKQYLIGALYNQDDIGRVSWKENNYNIAYPLRKHHAAIDLHNNNNLGIIIEKETPVSIPEITSELVKMLGQGETISELKRYYPELTLRQILIMKKIISSIENGNAAIIWDKYY